MAMYIYSKIPQNIYEVPSSKSQNTAVFLDCRLVYTVLASPQ